MDIQTARLVKPKLEVLRTFLKHVKNAGRYLPDNETRENYQAIYEDIKEILNDPNLEIYAPPLPHLGTVMGDGYLWEEHQVRILDSGIRLVTYLDAQLKLLFPSKNKTSSAQSSTTTKDFLTNISIENFQGILGNVDRSTVTQNLDLMVSKGDFESLSKKLLGLNVEQVDVDELKAAIVDEPIIIDPTKFGHKVSKWIGKMVQKAATGVWDVSVNTAGNILAILIARYYGF